MTDRTGLETSQELPLFTFKVRSENALSVSVVPSQFLEEESDLSLSERLSTLQTRPIEDLENSFFYCSKEYHLSFRDWHVSLQPLVTMHPLASLYTQQTGTVKSKIEGEIRDLVKSDLHSVHKYKWLLRVLDLIGKLAVKWRLFGSRDIEPRQSCTGSLVRSKQLGECQRLQEVVFVPDVVYLAASHSVQGAKLSLAKEVQQAAALAQALMTVVEFLVTLNGKVDFSRHSSITDYLYAGVKTSPTELMRVVPETSHQRQGLVPSSQKTSHAVRIGFHVFERGGLFARCCGRKPVHALNQKLGNLLEGLVRKYVEFERLLATHSVEVGN